MLYFGVTIVFPLPHRFLKVILKYTENLVTYTSPEKNKWEEATELTQNALLKIRTFLGKQQLLVQLANS